MAPAVPRARALLEPIAAPDGPEPKEIFVARAREAYRKLAPGARTRTRVTSFPADARFAATPSATSPVAPLLTHGP